MRTLMFLLLAVLGATAAPARSPVSLDPFSIALDFAPERPQPVSANHPLFRRVLVESVHGMPGRVGSFFAPVARPRDVDAALRGALAGANMLAQSPQDARARLRVTWRRFDLPFRIGFSSRAVAAVHYELSRIDNGQVIFSREIVTEAHARGGNATDRARGTGRAAIAANIASMAYCLDKAAVQGAPQDCALSPLGRFRAPIVAPVYSVRR